MLQAFLGFLFFTTVSSLTESSTYCQIQTVNVSVSDINWGLLDARLKSKYPLFISGSDDQSQVTLSLCGGLCKTKRRFRGRPLMFSAHAKLLNAISDGIRKSCCVPSSLRTTRHYLTMMSESAEGSSPPVLTHELVYLSVAQSCLCQ